LASAKFVVSGSTLGLVDVHRDEKASAELSGGLSVVAAISLGDKGCWV
jgi:hypothetical protein